MWKYWEEEILGFACDLAQGLAKEIMEELADELM